MAVGPVSLQVARDEFLSIVGPKGCGKSTLIRMIAGLVPVTSGKMEVAGFDPNVELPPFGVVFQYPTLFDWRTAMQNVLLQAELRGLDARRSEERAQHLLSMLGASGFASQRPRTLPPEIAQAVSICRALVHDPPILLLDDPFGMLDPLTRERLATDLQRLWLSSRKTVLLVTAHIREAIQLSDRVAVMSSAPGRIVETIAIDLPRPRRMDKATTPAIADYCNRVRTILQAQGVLP